MATLTSATGLTRQLLEALSRFATARLRRVGALSVYPDWEARAAICEQCPLRVISRGVSYCGNPLLQQIDRDPAIDGCGCPCRDKAKSPTEHCPIDPQHQASKINGQHCTCKWCTELSASRTQEPELVA